MDCTSADDLSCDSDQEWDSFTAPTPPPAFHHEGLRRSALRLAMPSTPGAPSTAQAGHRLDPKRMGSRPDPGFTRRGGTASAPAALRRSRRSALIWRRPRRLARLRLRGPALGRTPQEWAPRPTRAKSLGPLHGNAFAAWRDFEPVSYEWAEHWAPGPIRASSFGEGLRPPQRRSALAWRRLRRLAHHCPRRPALGPEPRRVSSRPDLGFARPGAAFASLGPLSGDVFVG